MSKEIIVTMIDNKPVIRTGDVWKRFGYESHQALKWVISQRPERFERSGVLTQIKEKPKSPKGGRPEISYLLNERQFLTLIQYVGNSEESMNFKDRITDEFFSMREKLATISTPSLYIEQVRKILLLDAPQEWVKLYPNEYYQALMQLYGKQFTSNNHTPPYCGQITKRWIYDVVLPPELNNEVDAQRKEERKHQWFKDKGRDILLKQILDVTGIARQSRDRKEFEARCASMFNHEPFQLMLMI
ncbi:Bacteriophage Mx8, p63, C-terminal [uncultured Caudovirales phage]|uniref:Bacteriophage Mx8, p63, C-terminal n=1 Tax=uncultured Caudovirales phage TaxID=2100421 RepID=A0A6J5LD00_9CAUD|nr:Bacteriophage Mx8, p63, C-terminal [uncultured Caudovirales phage]